MNYDGLCGEHFGKLNVKDNTKLTNKQQDTLKFDIGRMISEEDIIDQIHIVYYQNVGYWPSELCNDSNIVLNINRI